jgi:hypothetical protein
MTALAITEVLEGRIVDREALLDSIAEYATWLQEAERLVQAKSLEKAADLATLYGEGSWVKEWQEVDPPTTDAFGKHGDPDSRNRFARWLIWAEEQRGKSAPSRPHTLKLLDVHDTVSVLPHRSQVHALTSGVTARALEPLIRLKKIGYESRIPEVWNRAVELAEEDSEAERVTQTHVKEARAEFIGTLTPELQRQAVNIPRAQTLRAKAQAIVEDLWATGNTTECKKFYDWFAEFLRAQQEDAA